MGLHVDGVWWIFFACLSALKWKTCSEETLAPVVICTSANLMHLHEFDYPTVREREIHDEKEVCSCL